MPFCSVMWCTWTLILSLATYSNAQKPYKAIYKKKDNILHFSPMKYACIVSDSKVNLEI